MFAVPLLSGHQFHCFKILPNIKLVFIQRKMFFLIPRNAIFTEESDKLENES